MRTSAHGTRIGLGLLLAFGALNAFGGGFFGMSGAPGVPTQWLEGSPFSDYVVPGAILFTVVGGALALAAFGVLADRPWAVRASIGAAVVLLGWLTVQIAIIGLVSWLQPVTAVAGWLVLVLTAQLAFADQTSAAR
jgi:hypothetical protein